jgi:hypothetical protein
MMVSAGGSTPASCGNTPTSAVHPSPPRTNTHRPGAAQSTSQPDTARTVTLPISERGSEVVTGSSHLRQWSCPASVHPTPGRHLLHPRRPRIRSAASNPTRPGGVTLRTCETRQDSAQPGTRLVHPLFTPSQSPMAAATNNATSHGQGEGLINRLATHAPAATSQAGRAMALTGRLCGGRSGQARRAGRTAATCLTGGAWVASLRVSAQYGQAAPKAMVWPHLGHGAKLVTLPSMPSARPLGPAMEAGARPCRAGGPARQAASLQSTFP